MGTHWRYNNDVLTTSTTTTKSEEEEEERKNNKIVSRFIRLFTRFIRNLKAFCRRTANTKRIYMKKAEPTKSASRTGKETLLNFHIYGEPWVPLLPDKAQTQKKEENAPRTTPFDTFLYRCSMYDILRSFAHIVAAVLITRATPKRNVSNVFGCLIYIIYWCLTLLSRFSISSALSPRANAVCVLAWKGI